MEKIAKGTDGGVLEAEKRKKVLVVRWTPASGKGFVETSGKLAEADTWLLRMILERKIPVDADKALAGAKKAGGK